MSDVGLTSRISWTLVVDRLSGRGALPGHCEKMFLLTNLMRSFIEKKGYKEAKLGSKRQTEMYQHARCATEMGGTQKRNTNQCSRSPSQSLFSVQHLLFIPLPLFHNPDGGKKSTLKIF